MNRLNKLLNFSGGTSAPVILQTEAAECGLACLAMIAAHYGHKTDLNTLRRQFAISLKGTTLHEIIQLSEELDLSARAVRVSLKNMAKLQTPCIAHWDMNHFVVIHSIRKNRVIVLDPATGKRTLNLEEISAHFTGVALELSPTVQFKPREERNRIRLFDLWSRSKGFYRSLLHILLLSLLLQIFVIAAPFYMQLVLDEVVASYNDGLLTTLAIGFGLVVIVNILVTALRGHLILYLSNTFNLQIAYNIFQHLLKLPLSYFEKRHIGDVVSRFNSKDAIKEFMTQGIVSGIVDAIMATVTLIMMYLYAPLLATIVVVSVSCYIIGRLVWYLPFRQRTEESVVAAAKAESNFMETVRGVQSIKIFGQETERQNLWIQRYADVINADIRLGRFRVSYDAFNGLVFGLENILVVYAGAQMVLAKAITVGMLMAFIAYKTQFTGKVSELVEQMINFKMLDVHLERISDIVLNEPDTHTRGTIAMPPVINGRIELKDISYRYSRSEPWLFRNLNLVINPGETVAIVGGSGCGKSTLMKIMLGLAPPGEGQVSIDNLDIRELGLKNYRERIGTVMQNDQLLSGSIADNISFFCASPDGNQVRQCAATAVINHDIESMPMQYNSLVGDMGTTLSGGQKQRILLARALYRSPSILFLDEATSHLDTRLEGAVNGNMKQMGMTTVMIAHRPDTIRWADRIFELKNGQIQELERAEPVEPAERVANQTAQPASFPDRPTPPPESPGTPDSDVESGHTPDTENLPEQHDAAPSNRCETDNSIVKLFGESV